MNRIYTKNLVVFFQKGILFSFIVLSCAVLVSGESVHAQNTVSAKNIDMESFKKKVMSAKPAADQMAKPSSGLTITENTYKYSTSTRTVSGTVVFKGGLGQQNNVIYGVAIANKDGFTAVTQLSGVIASIKEGEIVSKDFSYTVPSWVTGQQSVFLSVYTEDGLSIATKYLLTNTFTGTKTTLPCAVIERVNDVACLTSKDTAITLTYSKTPLFQTTLLKETVNLKANEKVVLNPELPAGAYYVAVSDGNTGGVLYMTKKGVSGSIDNIMVYTDAAKKLFHVSSQLSFTYFATSSEVTFSLTDEKNAPCGEKVVRSGEYFVDTVIENPSCTSGAITVTLKDSVGKVLDTEKQPFSIIAVKQEETKNKFEGSTIKVLHIVVGLVVTAVLVGVVFIIRFYIRKRQGLGGGGA